MDFPTEPARRSSRWAPRPAGRGLLGAGLALGAVNTALGIDIARNAVVQGANDNLSGVATLVDLAAACTSGRSPDCA